MGRHDSAEGSETGATQELVVVGGWVPNRTNPDLKKHSPGRQRTFSSSISFWAKEKVVFMSLHLE